MIYRYYPHFMNVDTKVQVRIACQKEGLLSIVSPARKKLLEDNHLTFTFLVYPTEDSVVLSTGALFKWF